MPTLTKFDDSKAQPFTKKLVTLAFRTGCPVTYFKDWAGPEGQVLPEPHMVMVTCDEQGHPVGEVYGCDMKAFEETYEEVAWNSFRKKTPIRAMQVNHDFTWETILADGTVEVAEGHGKAGDWLVKNPGGEVYRIAADIFAQQYDPT